MRWNTFKEKAINLLIIDKKTFKNLENSESALDYNIKYWLKTGKIIKLKNGTYIIKAKWDTEKDKGVYLEYIANQMLSPSYISLEYVLSKYQLLTEAPTTITSITTKSGRSFANKLTTFNYYSISEKLFTGYKTEKFRNAFVNIASKEKALFDFLYFQFLQKEPNKQKIDNLRINWENITEKELKRSQQFCKLTKNRNIKKIFEIIC
ncbi:MAG: hypothetical protein U9Q72_02050 [Patescibacteria group bacterium]|nr:hypothetical protein [Patescibacteria group bacterium]